MKIERDKKDFRNYNPLRKTEVREVRRGADTSFEQELTGRKEAEQQFRMQEILAEIDKLNQRLNKSLNINDLMLYKKLVRNFLKEATSRAYILNQERGRNRRGRSLLLTISTIDKEIEQVIEDFIKNKTEPVDVLTRLDKIRGMLVDLMI